MTPSGGARNPFEAYVCARNVEGLAPGVYHYAGADGSLAPVEGARLPALSELVGGQPWCDRAGALVLLVASFRRTMWKYGHPGALRVVLIEAGHIAQNILACAAFHRLAAAPTCAVSDMALEPLLGLDPLERAVLHTVALGVPASSPAPADFERIAENPAFPGWLSHG
jgi:SagB-type dehydrogenase family enzyme